MQRLVTVIFFKVITSAKRLKSLNSLLKQHLLKLCIFFSPARHLNKLNNTVTKVLEENVSQSPLKKCSIHMKVLSIVAKKDLLSKSIAEPNKTT